MKLRTSFGSGLARRPGDPPGEIWGVGDRGPNIKVRTLLDLYGAEQMRPIAERVGAKVMPRLDVGPQIARLRIVGDRIELVESLGLHRRIRCAGLRPADPRGRACPARAGLRPRGRGARAGRRGLRHRGHRRHPGRRVLDRRRIRSLAGARRRPGQGRRPPRAGGSEPWRYPLPGARHLARDRGPAASQPRLRGAGAVRRRKMAVPRFPESARPSRRRRPPAGPARADLASRRRDARSDCAISLSARSAG